MTNALRHSIPAQIHIHHHQHMLGNTPSPRTSIKRKNKASSLRAILDLWAFHGCSNLVSKLQPLIGMDFDLLGLNQVQSLFLQMADLDLTEGITR